MFSILRASFAVIKSYTVLGWWQFKQIRRIWAISSIFKIKTNPPRPPSTLTFGHTFCLPFKPWSKDLSPPALNPGEEERKVCWTPEEKQQYRNEGVRKAKDHNQTLGTMKAREKAFSVCKSFLLLAQN